MRFEHLVSDAETWIKSLQADSRFNRVVVIGHSEGSLIGMIAARNTHTHGFISLAGAGIPAAQIIDRQLQAQSPALAQKAAAPLAQLVQGQTVQKYPMALNSLFRASVQPYLISWFKYHPRKEIAKLQQPVLIVQGDHDLQVEVSDAEALYEAQPHAQKQILKGMNHVLKTAPMNRASNLKTYAQPDLPLHDALLPILVDFIEETTQAATESKMK
jgi:pimeloyl-ACP methyl ester carboxylesterase